MRWLALLALVACSNAQPPPIQDSDGAVPQFDDDASRPPVIVDSGADGGTSEVLDFAGTCTSSGFVPVWHYFDFQTHTPEDSSLAFSASTADTEDALANAASVALATVNGADITTWTGVDVDAKLQTIDEQSHAFLRITITLTPATDGTPPALVHYRQEYDCIVGQ
jgi:hypothetical protein